MLTGPGSISADIKQKACNLKSDLADDTLQSLFYIQFDPYVVTEPGLLRTDLSKTGRHRIIK
jgi:hypothetical protein